MGTCRQCGGSGFSKYGRRPDDGPGGYDCESCHGTGATYSRKYHFSLGNSTTGPVGFCAMIVADTPEEAMDRLQALLPDEVLVHDQGEEYIGVYFNPREIERDDIDSVENSQEAA